MKTRFIALAALGASALMAYVATSQPWAPVVPSRPTRFAGSLWSPKSDFREEFFSREEVEDRCRRGVIIFLPEWDIKNRKEWPTNTCRTLLDAARKAWPEPERRPIGQFRLVKKDSIIQTAGDKEGHPTRPADDPAYQAPLAAGDIVTLSMHLD